MTTKRILDDETRKALLGHMPFSATATIDFTPPKYNEIKVADEFKPVYKLRGMTNAERDHSKVIIQDVEKERDALIELTRKCILGFSNMFDIGTCEEIEFKSDPEGGCDKELVKRIHESELATLFFQICKISNLFDVDRLALE